MLLLILGKGKTGSIVAQVARERGHSVRVLDRENAGASALTAPTLAQFDVVLDFTNAEAAVENMRACLALGARIVVGTTGWYSHLDEMKAHALRRKGGLLYGTNFSLGVNELFKMTADLAALTLQEIIKAAQPEAQVEINSKREGDASGLHVVTARSANDLLTLRHESFDRRGFAEGAVRAAEWLAGKSGVWEFREIFEKL